MKSREYRNTHNGLIYWLENNSVMVRNDNGRVIRSLMTAAEFFIAVGNDRLELVEG